MQSEFPHQTSEDSHWFNAVPLFLACLVVCVVTILLLTPKPYELTQFLRELKPRMGRGYLVHFGVYSLLTMVMFIATGFRKRRYFLPATFLLVAHAGITEILQIWIPSRDSDPVDLLANLAGIACGVICCLSIQQMKQSA